MGKARRNDGAKEIEKLSRSTDRWELAVGSEHWGIITLC